MGVQDSQRHCKATVHQSVSRVSVSLLEQLSSQLQYDSLADDDITAERLAKSSRVSQDTARRFLQKQVESGKLVAVKVRGGNVWITAYREVK